MWTQLDDTDAVFEPEMDADASFDADIDEIEENATERIKALKTELKTAQKERKDYLDGWQRAKADYLNSQKRFEEERGDIKRRAEIHFIEKILPLADSFSMALGVESDEKPQDGNAWKSGLTQIHRQLATLLTELGVSEIGAEGDAFDPRHHEALGQEKVTNHAQADTLVKVLQKGYLYRDTVIRPAKVIIGSEEGK